MAGDGVEIGTAYVTILPDGSRIGPEVKKSFGVVDNEADRVGKTAGKKFGGVFNSTAGKVMAGAGGVFAIAKAKDFLGESIGIASDLNEAGTKLEAIFGKADAQVQRFAEGGAKALGQSRLDVLDAAATFGVFGKAAGLQGPKLAKFSTRLTTLSTDLASFHTADPSEVVEALGSALRGEAEPMRRFGVLMDDASLKAEAMAQGLIKPVKDRNKIETAMARVTIAQSKYNDAVKKHGKDSMEALSAQASLGSAQSTLQKATEGTIQPLTAQQKTLAAQGLIYKQTKDAQGDFAKTSDGLANQQRILSARFSDLKGEIGQKFLPVAIDVVGFLNDKAMPAVEGFIDGFSNGKGAGGKARELFDDIRAAGEDLFDSFESSGADKVFEDIFGVVKDVPGFIRDIATEFDKLPDGVKKAIFVGGGALAAKKLLGGGSAGGAAPQGLTSKVVGAVKDKGAGLIADKLLAKFSKPLPVFVVNQGPGGGSVGGGGANPKPKGGGRGVGPVGGAAALLGANLIIENLGDKSGPFEVFEKSLKLLPELKAAFGDVDTSAQGLLGEVGKLDKELAGAVQGDGAAAFGRFQRISDRTGLSIAELGELLPKTRDKVNDLGGRAKYAEQHTSNWKTQLFGTNEELRKLDAKDPRVKITTNIPSVRQQAKWLKADLDAAVVEREARVRLATYYADKDFRAPGIQRASGGPVWAGSNYRINESGPGEAFVPEQNGRILSKLDAMAALAGGRGPGVQINIDKVMPQDYRGFQKDMQARARRTAVGGVDF